MNALIDAAIARVKMAHEALQQRAEGEKLYCAYSGGKDSDCLISIARRAVGEAALEVNYNATGIDPPELVKHVKQRFRVWEEEGMECYFNKPKANMHDLIVRKGPPLRMRRFCCEALKEGGGDGRIVLMGVRWAESPRRARDHGVVTVMSKDKHRRAVYTDDNDVSRSITEPCPYRSKLTVNPIVDWPNEMPLHFLRESSIPYCNLYDEGWLRLGCIGCPMASTRQRLRDFARWPHMKRYYMRAFDDMLAARPDKFRQFGWRTVDDVWHWWLEDGVVPGQIGIELDEYEAIAAALDAGRN